MKAIEKKIAEEVVTPPEKLPRLDCWREDGKCLYGVVYNHPRIPDGEFVFTSALSWLRRDLKLAQTQNTLYALLEERPL